MTTITTLHFTITSADLRVLQLKSIIIAISILLYGLAYYFSNDLFLSAFISLVVATIIIAVITHNIRDTFRGAVAGYGLYLIIIYMFLGATVIGTTIAAALTPTFGALNAIDNTKNEKYKISVISNIISTILQFVFSLLGFYIAQHLQIHLIWGV